MNDNKIDYEFVQVTPESMDAHVQCLKENGYNINKTFTLFSKYLFAFLLGGYLIKLIS